MFEHHVPEAYREYLKSITSELERLNDVAKKARSKGLDPSPEPESKFAGDSAERVEKLVGPEGVAERIRELSKSMSMEEVAFKVAEEIVYGRFGRGGEEAAEQAVRTALAILTEGVTVAPIQGITEVRVKRNRDGTRYLSVYFAGPIRTAGGTDAALSVVVADYVRRRLGIGRYVATEEEVKRYVEEIRLYERKVRRFQYHVSDEAIELAVRGLPVEVTGVGTETVEVSSYRDLPRVETNRLRGGALIVLNDGIIGRARKVLAVVNRLGLEGWSWLEELEESREKSPGESFMKEIVAGRPVFSFPSRPGGFRLRYGRARNTGLAAVGVHPATMIVLQRFLATGVQLRLELPGKSAIVCPVDSIEPPVVRLKDGSVVRVETVEMAEKILGQVDRILFVGDILISLGDFLHNNRPLLPSGYVEEWWLQEVQERVEEVYGDLQRASKSLQVSLDALTGGTPTPEEALRISKALGVPLHPRYTYPWSNITVKEALRLREWLGRLEDLGGEFHGEVDVEVKKVLEKLLVPHRVSGEEIILGGDGRILLECLRPRAQLPGEAESMTPLELVKAVSGMEVREKSPSYVGARMGRPEKARRREMSPYVHVLFPVGTAGGPQRNLVKAAENGSVRVEIALRRCPRCGSPVFGYMCQTCRVPAEAVRVCQKCGRPTRERRCPACGSATRGYDEVVLDLKTLLEEAVKKVGVRKPQLIKGVKSLMSEDRVPEPLEKGVLRAVYDLSVFKDGTCRFDVTNAPLTHFKPSEIGVSVEKLRELGYTHDVHGRPLESPDQVLELRIQDVILPEECGDYLVKVAKFVDDELQRIYGLPPYYNAETRGDLVGHLVVGLAPHTSAGVVGRIVGFTKTHVCYAHPVWHAAKRRNCDGDEDAVMLALDVLLNFSRSFLPAQIGGLMDAPVLLIPVVNPAEVDTEAHHMEVMAAYPRKVYEISLLGAGPRDYAPLIETVEDRLGSGKEFCGFWYTMEASNINFCGYESAYKRLKTMMDKLESQLELSEKIVAVDVRDVARRVLTTHFMKDIVGNLRAFTSQSLRCVKCNRRFRRPPLRGICPRCGERLTLTVFRGGIEKYIEAAEKLVEKYGLEPYYKQRLNLLRKEIDSLFVPSEGVKQASISDFI